MNFSSILPMKFHNGPGLIDKMRYWAKFPSSPTSLGFLQLPVSHSYKLGTKTVRILSVWESFHPVSFGSEKALARPRRALLIKDLMLPSKFLLHDSIRLLGKHLSSRSKTEILLRAARGRSARGWKGLADQVRREQPPTQAETGERWRRDLQQIVPILPPSPPVFHQRPHSSTRHFLKLK